MLLIAKPITRLKKAKIMIIKTTQQNRGWLRKNLFKKRKKIKPALSLSFIHIFLELWDFSSSFI